MTGALSLWTTGPGGLARVLFDGRVPVEAVTLALAAPATVPDDAVLELVADDDRTVAPRRVAGPPGPWVWVTDRAALAGASSWRAQLVHDDALLASLELVLETPAATRAAADPRDEAAIGAEAGFRFEPEPLAAPSRATGAPRVRDLRVEAILRDGTRRSAADVEAAEVAVLSITAEFEPTAQRKAGSLTVRVDDPRGQSLTAPAAASDAATTSDPDDPDDTDAGSRVSAAVATVLARPFVNGDWTLSLFHDRTLLRRVRLRLAHSPMRVRAARLLAISPEGARPTGERLTRADLAGRLVFAFELGGLCLGARATATFSLLDAAGAQLAGWNVSIDRGDPAALERAWFPLPPRLLAQARLPVTARLLLDGAESHTQLLDAEPETARFRSDGVVLDAPADGPPPTGFGPAQAFFGLVERLQRRRRRKAEPPPPEDDELPF